MGGGWVGLRAIKCAGVVCYILLGVQARGGWEPRMQSIAVPRPSRAGNPIVIARVFIIIFPFVKVVAQPKPYMVES